MPSSTLKMGVNDTLCEIAKTDYSIGFSELPEQCCRPTHVEPFKADVHLFGFECQENIMAIVIIALITFAIKIFQNFLGGWMGQLERELMHMQKKERKVCGKLGKLVLLELVAGVLGVASILFITGNNFYIWVTVIVSNAIGIMLALSCTRPDHHSPAAEMEALLNIAEKEDQRALKVLNRLKCMLKQIPDAVILVKSGLPMEIGEESPLLRKRLKL